ncbi:MAG TPA: hypothetical protein V6D26_21135 [Stenomitos sp.]
MHPPLSKQPQPKPENKYPDCLYMELSGTLVQPDNQEHLAFWRTSTQRQPIDLYLTIHFNEQWESLAQGRVKFGLKGGELRLKLENSEIPYESRELVGTLELANFPKKQERDRSQERKNPLGQLIMPRATAKPITIASHFNGNKPKAQVSFGTQPKPFLPEASITVCHVTTKVTEENPVWIFEEEMGEPVFKGVLNQVKLATVNVLALPCRIEARFEVSKRDVCLTDAEGLWPPDISRNKRAVLDRLIIQRLLEPKLKPYLSRAELRYE